MGFADYRYRQSFSFSGWPFCEASLVVNCPSDDTHTKSTLMEPSKSTKTTYLSQQTREKFTNFALFGWFFDEIWAYAVGFTSRNDLRLMCSVCYYPESCPFAS